MNKKLTLKNAIEFINNNGSELDKAKINLILKQEEDPSRQVILDHFTLLQNNDGGFPYQFQRNKISTINHTVSALFSLTDYNLIENDIVEQGIEFLFRKQNIDGSWDEPDDLMNYQPPEWNKPGEITTQLWITANACHLLTELEYIPSPYLTKGLNFLLQHKEPTGKLQGYLLSNWIIVAVLGTMHGIENELTQNFITIIDENLDKILNTSDAIWCLRCLIDGGLPTSHSTVLKLYQNLIENQRQDGGWDSVDGKNFDIRTTLDIIRLFTNNF